VKRRRDPAAGAVRAGAVHSARGQASLMMLAVELRGDRAVPILVYFAA
jgi:hypothetical protein